SAPTPGGPPMLYLMEEIATGPLPQALIDQMQPLHRLDDVEALLKRNRVGFAWRETEVSSAQMSPQLARQMAALPPHEVFVAPQGQGWIMGAIVSQRADTAPRQRSRRRPGPEPWPGSPSSTATRGRTAGERAPRPPPGRRGWPAGRGAPSTCT